MRSLVILVLLLAACGSTLESTAGAPPSTSSSAPASPTPVASASAIAVAPDRDSVWEYFTRAGLPPIGAFVRGVFSDGSREQRILSRISVLHDSHITPVPPGASNPIAAIAPPVGGHGQYSVAVQIAFDVATVEFDVPTGWGARTEVEGRALIQQLVYVITDEPGVRNALITEHGKPNAIIAGIVIDHPMPREEVDGYHTKGTIGQYILAGDDTLGAVGATLVSREIEDGTLVRLSFEGRDRAHNDAVAALPTVTATYLQNDGSLPHNRTDGPPPAYHLALGFRWNATGSSGGVGHVERIDRSPLRLLAGDFNVGYEIGLDEARPWRMYKPDPAHLVVEIGGLPDAINDRITASGPFQDGAVVLSYSSATTVTGLGRFATLGIGWRLLDGAGAPIASGVTNAPGTTGVEWGTYRIDVTVPPSSRPQRLEISEIAGEGALAKFWVSLPVVIR